jgi:general stress protein 26
MRYNGWQEGATMDETPDWERYSLNEEEAAKLIAEAMGCVVTWTRRDGHPAAAYVAHVIIDGHIYMTAPKSRAKNAALRRDPRTAVVFENGDLGEVTIIGRVEFDDRPKIGMRVLEAIADKYNVTGKQREFFIRALDTPGRTYFRLVEEKRFSLNTAQASAYLRGRDPNET